MKDKMSGVTRRLEETHMKSNFLIKNAIVL